MMELSQRLAKLRKEAALSAEVPDYTLETLTGSVTLSSFQFLQRRQSPTSSAISGLSV